MGQPYISIITPCFNGQEYIENAIESIIQQPLGDIELIIINDGSTDKTEQILIKCAERDNRVKFYTTENKGAGHARNFGIDRALGKWIMFLDSDDLYLLNSLNSQFKQKLVNYEDEDVDILYTAKCMTDMHICKRINIIKAPEPHEVNTIPYLEFCACVYRKQFLLNNSIRFYEFKRQDIESAFRYLTYSKAKKIVTDNKCLFYIQRDNLQSNTHTWNLQTLHEVKCLVYYDLCEYHATEQAKKLLMTTMLQELCEYYSCCRRKGVNDFDSLNNINKIMKKIIVNSRIVILLIGKRKWAGCLMNCLFVNLLKKSSVVENNRCEKKEIAVDKYNINERLRELSRFINILIE